jgi:uncharacterized protein YgiM (DUF1202 family)
MRIPFLLILIPFIASCNQPEKIYDPSVDIDSIVHKFVPDNREGIADITFIKNSDGSCLFKGETDQPELKSAIRTFLAARNISFTDSLLILPDTSQIKYTKGLVSVSVCNMKRNPSHSSELVSQSVMGTPVRVLKKRGGWLLIQTPDRYLGWVTAGSIAVLSEKEMKLWRQSEKIIYLSVAGNILSAEAEPEVISDIVSGVILLKKGERGKNYTVELPDGREGLVSKAESYDFEKWKEMAEPDAEKLFRFASSLKGYPYLWGGTSTKASDCSGFVKTVYFTGGIILARDASLQFLYGNNVDINNSLSLLLPGDLLFFGYLNADSVKKITHVGMYIGNGRLIHSSGMVRINSLFDDATDYSESLKKDLMGARRIIGTTSGRGIERVKDCSWYMTD